MAEEEGKVARRVEGGEVVEADLDEVGAGGLGEVHVAEHVGEGVTDQGDAD